MTETIIAGPGWDVWFEATCHPLFHATYGACKENPNATCDTQITLPTLSFPSLPVGSIEIYSTTGGERERSNASPWDFVLWASSSHNSLNHQIAWSVSSKFRVHVPYAAPFLLDTYICVYIMVWYVLTSYDEIELCVQVHDDHFRSGRWRTWRTYLITLYEKNKKELFYLIFLWLLHHDSDSKHSE